MLSQAAQDEVMPRRKEREKVRIQRRSKGNKIEGGKERGQNEGERER